jgi:hypothetical protein
MYLGQFCRLQAHTVFLKTRARRDGLQADKTKRSRLMHGLAVFACDGHSNTAACGMVVLRLCRV